MAKETLPLRLAYVTVSLESTRLFLKLFITKASQQNQTDRQGEGFFKGVAGKSHGSQRIKFQFKTEGSFLDPRGTLF